MAKVLMWEKPEKIMSIEKWKNISADNAPPGVYVPNMSKEDMLKWKAKLISGKRGAVPRVEIRKTFTKSNNEPYPNGKNVYCQALIIVSFDNIDGFKNCNVLMSMNGKCGMSFKEVVELNEAIAEAREVLWNLY
jgi:hypothetical protein